MLDSNPAYRSEFDRRNVKAVETARKKWEAAQIEEQDEAKKLEKMTAAQRERYQLDKDRAAFDAQRASFAAEQMRVTVGAELQKRGLKNAPVLFDHAPGRDVILNAYRAILQ